SRSLVMYFEPLYWPTRLPVMQDLVVGDLDIKIKPPVRMMSMADVAVPSPTPQMRSHHPGSGERPNLANVIASQMCLDSDVHEIATELSHANLVIWTIRICDHIARIDSIGIGAACIVSILYTDDRHACLMKYFDTFPAHVPEYQAFIIWSVDGPRKRPIVPIH